MTCLKCNQDFTICECADLKQRIDVLRKLPYVDFSVEYMAQVQAHIKAMKERKVELPPA